MVVNAGGASFGVSGNGTFCYRVIEKRQWRILDCLGTKKKEILGFL